MVRKEKLWVHNITSRKSRSDNGNVFVISVTIIYGVIFFWLFRKEVEIITNFIKLDNRLQVGELFVILRYLTQRFRTIPLKIGPSVANWNFSL